MRFCREGRTKLCRKCQKPGHIQSHCPNVFKCGHCAEGQPTRDCPSTRGQAIPVKCANCGGGHRPVSQECAVRIAAMKEAKQALLIVRHITASRCTSVKLITETRQHHRLEKSLSEGTTWMHPYMHRTGRRRQDLLSCLHRP